MNQLHHPLPFNPINVPSQKEEDLKELTNKIESGSDSTLSRLRLLASIPTVPFFSPQPLSK